jgi:DNA-binding NarL/FixJ family response regulator
MKPKITICIADDHPVFLAGMKSIISLEKHLKILGSAENGK